MDKYTTLGVSPNKIYKTVHASVCVWSKTRKCLVGENGIPSLELVKKENNKVYLTYKNNHMVFLKNYTKIDVNKINKSEGIIVNDIDSEYFRFSYIPST